MAKRDADEVNTLESETEAGAEGGGDASPEAADRFVALLDPELLGDVIVELSASLGKGVMSLAGLARMKSGELIALDAPLNGSVDLLLGGRLVARGDLVAVGDNFGVRITDVLARKS